MTINQFLKRLPKDGWRITESGEIRRGCSCPITCLGKREFKNAANWCSVAADLGLCENDAVMIVDAADNAERHDPKLRRRLLRACGLKEKP